MPRLARVAGQKHAFGNKDAFSTLQLILASKAYRIQSSPECDPIPRERDSSGACASAKTWRNPPSWRRLRSAPAPETTIFLLHSDGKLHDRRAKMASRWHVRIALAAAFLLLLLLAHRNSRPRPPSDLPHQRPAPAKQGGGRNKLDWASVPQRYPVAAPRAPPSASGAAPVPRIQARFGRETKARKRTRLARLAAVRGNFTHAWGGYREHAWLRDEVAPLSGRGLDPFGGWAATLVDSLGTFVFSRLLSARPGG